MKIFLAALICAVLTSAIAKIRFTRYQSWNSRMYPVWKDGDSRYKDCWRGGEVTFDVRNDSPTISGAKVTFNIDIRFPQNQTVQPDGQVVWSQNCTINGTYYNQGQPVYPDGNSTREWTGVFPDGTPFTKTSDRKPRYVFVWKTWGRYWQVADGPSSSLTIGTDNVATGSYSMEAVIYHCRGRDKFIPLGYAYTQFSITDQIPFTVSLMQMNDVNRADQSFIQNRAIAFTINLHDPSQYLKDSDVTFNWDFGDGSGTLISREFSSTHTYVSSGLFRPRVVLQASIPSTGCSTPGDAPTPANPTAASVTSQPPVPPAQQSTTGSLVPSAVPVVVSTAGSDVTVNPPATARGDGLALEVSEQPAQEQQQEEVTEDPALAADPAVADITEEGPATPPAPALQDPTLEEATADIALTASVLPPDAEGTAIPVVLVAVTVPAGAAVTEAAQAEDEADPVTPAASVTAVDVVPASAMPSEAADAVELNAESAGEATAAAGVAVGTGTVAAQVPMVVAKRQAPEMPTDAGCVIYRYGSFSTNLDIVQGIESVEIVQVANVVMMSELEQSAVDFTITCQGSLPSEVCTVISDADCVTPVQRECSSVTPSPECQMILRQFFNNSGVFCINVSLTNDVSLAATSARVSVAIDSRSSSAGTVVAVLGVVVLAFAIGAIAYTYRRFKEYRPLREGMLGTSERTSLPMLIWNLLSRHSSGESRPLLQGGVV